MTLNTAGAFAVFLIRLSHDSDISLNEWRDQESKLSTSESDILYPTTIR
jgi:hypothetical protein